MGARHKEAAAMDGHFDKMAHFNFDKKERKKAQRQLLRLSSVECERRSMCEDMGPDGGCTSKRESTTNSARVEKNWRGT
jgi:hypothetical protein